MIDKLINIVCKLIDLYHAMDMDIILLSSGSWFVIFGVICHITLS